MSYDLDSESGPHEKNKSQLIGYYLEYSLTATKPMFIYDLFQTGIIFIALIAGFICISNLVFVTGTRCKNFDLLFSTLVVGFLHLLTCVLMLRISEDSAISEIPRGGNQRCVDYFLPATISNTVVLITISLSIIDRNVTSCIRKLFSKAVFLASIGTGAYLLYLDSSELSGNLHQEVFLTLDTKQHEQINFLWSVCLKSFHDAQNRLFIEYCFIYTPVFVVVIAAWYAAYSKTKDRSLMRVQIMAVDCLEYDEFDDENDVQGTKYQLIKIKCFCSRLNSAFVAIVVYCGIIFLVLRPAMIVYGYVTSGNIRDLLPSLLHTVIYCFLCSEFLLRVYRQRLYRIRKQLVASSLGTKV